MFQFIKNVVLLGLLAAGLFLGLSIYNKSTDLDLHSVEQKALLEKEIKGLTKEVAERAKALTKTLIGKKADHVEDPVESKKCDEKGSDTKGADCDAADKAAPPKSDSKPSIPLEPEDEEDRILTVEVLTEEKTAEEKPEPAQPDINLYSPANMEEKPREPLDLDRVARIREFYARALETLDFK